MEKFKDNKKQIIIFNVLIIMAFILTLQNVCMPIGQRMNYSDSSIYQYIGSIMLKGKMPYIDAFDHKGPILYLINMIGCLINIRWGIWLIDLIFMSGIMMYAYKLSNKFLNSEAALIVVLIIMPIISRGYWIGNTPDFYATFFIMVATYLLVDYYMNGELEKKSCLVIGGCIALVFWMKQNLIIPIGILCLFILMDNVIKKKYRVFVRCIICASIGFVLPTVLIGIWLGEKNVLNSMIKDYFEFNFLYASSQCTRLQQLNALIEFLHLPSLALVCLAGIIYWIIKLIYGDMNKRNDYMGIYQIVFCISLYGCIMAGRPYQQYPLILYPIIIVIMSLTVKCCIIYDSKYVKIFMLTSLVFIIYSIVIPNFQTMMKNQINNLSSIEEDKIVCDTINQNAEEDDTIAVVSADHCGYYLATQHEAATKYPYIQVMFYNDKNFWKKYIDELNKSNPQIIIWNNNWKIDDYLNEYIKSYKEIKKTDRLIVYSRIK